MLSNFFAFGFIKHYAKVLHNIPDKNQALTRGYELIAENLMENTCARQLMKELCKYEVMPDPFIDGKCYMVADKSYLVDQMAVPDAMKAYIRQSRQLVDDMDTFLSQNKIQKITINFASRPDGHRIDIDEVKSVLEKYPELVAVTGGIRNIEVSDKKATKGAALMALADDLGVHPSEIIAFGDSENDITMLQDAGIGVAMGNSLDITIEAADAVTKTNDEEGVAIYLEELMADNKL